MRPELENIEAKASPTGDHCGVGERLQPRFLRTPTIAGARYVH